MLRRSYPSSRTRRSHQKGLKQLWKQPARALMLIGLLAGGALGSVHLLGLSVFEALVVSIGLVVVGLLALVLGKLHQLIQRIDWYLDDEFLDDELFDDPWFQPKERSESAGSTPPAAKVISISSFISSHKSKHPH